MSYFIPTTIQKRLLRYVLSRLQLLDTDALDLEKLDIGWGRRSTIELRDVGLRIAKLSALLDLPDSLRLDHASIVLLRITVPADIHTSSIVIEVVGIEATVKLAEDNRRARKTAKNTNQDAARSAQSHLPRASLKPAGRYPSFSPASSSLSSDEEDRLPTPRDLAASFLADEPAEEKRQLEAALNSQSTDLRQSVTSVGSGDDEPNTGLGVGVGLPGFLAAFLRGIGDRLQVKIRDVAIKLEVDIEHYPGGGFEPSQKKAPITTTMCLHVEEIDVGEMNVAVTTTNESTSKSGRSGGDLRSNTHAQLGKRRIVLNRIYGSIVSENEISNQVSGIFDKDTTGEVRPMSASAPAKQPIAQSALQHPSSFPTDRSGETHPSVRQSRNRGESDVGSSTWSGPAPGYRISERTSRVTKTVVSADELPRAASLYFAETAPVVQGSRISIQSQQTLPELVNVESEPPYSPTRSMSADELCSSSQEPGESYSKHLHDSLKSFREERSPSTSSSILRSRRLSRSPSPPKSPPSLPRSPSPQLQSYDDQQFRSSNIDDSTSMDAPIPDLSRIDTQLDQESPPVNEELAESMMFSREEAESIYMSAVHETPQIANKSLRMPGAWDDSRYEDNTISTFKLSPRICSDTVKNPGRTDAMGDSSSTIEPQLNARDKTTEAGALNKLTTQIFALESSEKESYPNVGSGATEQPRQPLARKILELDKAEVWLPAYTDNATSVHTATPDSIAQSSTERSVHHSLPGSFSLYAESKSSERGLGNAIRSRVLPTSSNSDRVRPATPSEKPLDGLYEVILHSVRARTDSSTSRIMVEIFRRIRSPPIDKFDQTPGPGNDRSDSPSNNRSASYAVRVQNLALQFVEALESETVSTHGENFAFPRSEVDPSDGVLFILSVKDLGVNVKGDASSATKFDIGKITFGFSDQDILSFSKQSRLRTSVRDLNSASEKDISISFGGQNNSSDMHIDTQPLCISLDLQRLDNTLGSVGGLSGLIELGNSIASESTITASSPKANQRSRTVHFETPSAFRSEQASATKSRFNIRLSGAALSIQGKACSIEYHSSAIKVVGREALIGVRIDDIRITGPYRTPRDEAAVKIRLRDTSLKYLFVPEEPDLTRLISLLTPSKNKFEDDDDFLVDTLIRQRRKGSVLRTNVSKLDIEIRDLDSLTTLQNLAQEMSRLSSVTKYLPEENRPGLMTLGLVENVTLNLQAFHKLDRILLDLKSTEFAHISFPSLVALSLGKISLDRSEGQKIITEVLPLNNPHQPPMLMARMIGDELEPTLKVKLWNVCFEYSIPLVMAILDLADDASHEDVSDALTSSIASLSEPLNSTRTHVLSEPGNQQSVSEARSLLLNLELRDCSIGLTPRILPSKGLFMMTDARFSGALPDEDGLNVVFELRKASLLVVDDVQRLVANIASTNFVRPQSNGTVSHHILDLCQLGFVSVSTISAALMVVKSTHGLDRNPGIVDIEFKDELFVLETCADSTQTLIETMSGLTLPVPPSKGQRYRTEVAPMEDMMASFTGNAFPVRPTSVGDQVSRGEDPVDEDLAMDFDTLSDISDLGSSSQRIAGDPPLDFSSGYLSELKRGPILAVGKKWDSANNRYIAVNRSELVSSPVQVRIRDMHIIWNLYDGYDWEKTRDTITKAVQDVEAKAEEKRFGRRIAFDEEEEKESVISDFLFNSIYIGIPVNHDPQELTRQINRNIDDLVSETASHISTANSRPSSSHRTPRGQHRKLKLERSKRHKVAFELRGVSVDFFGFAPGAETQSSTDVRITDFEIFDHVPTSTWKKFATYMRDAGPREERKPMVHLEICDVKPVPELEATELVIRASVLPVRLHVDQDALDFITRFFDFKDDTRPLTGPPAEQPYLQRVEVRAVPIRLDYKPKKVDYAGLRSGRTTEFMNFFILDGADMILKHTIVYGTSGFTKLHKSLEDVWMPDIRRNQLPGVLSGLNGVRTLVNVATGVHDLVVIPVREYQKDGRIVRSISKGALAFAKTTGGELTRFGAKLAIGAQTALQGAEDFFVKPNQLHGEAGWEAGDLDPDEKRAISHYANQPTGILQGLKGAARSLERDLLVTKDIIIAISGEARESGSAEGAARAVVRHAPTLILRPMIGASKAISQTLMGATNTVDPQNRRRIEDKYKRY